MKRRLKSYNIPPITLSICFAVCITFPKIIDTIYMPARLRIYNTDNLNHCSVFPPSFKCSEHF